ncbi:O-linked N-acetylglucosamine transferase, SPINDLY family protein [Rubrivivax benzoatilyticus]|uniref:protein O-GlcNAc transferase n=1 Tax=Rubrivivax benzoatilyticus TaxID=316997 RepID=A0ABX0HZR5_9BURK|nr:glycosyltransferase family 41 protein [Rubrivivax benzoatilyticus]NHK99910.1 tetratricopeptide repeat protein [Rubrivivax benzoatilyticus]NHL25811.1 tetratricopeptide repeat protein [Rubrivivax benzoatilyticus]
MKNATAGSDHRARTHWQAGAAAVKVGRWQRAAEEFERAARLAPGDALYWLNLGRARLQLGQNDAAIQAFNAVTKSTRGYDTITALTAAQCLSALHRYADAAACLDAAPAGVVRDHAYHSTHGYALFRAGRHHEAIEAYFRALSLKMDAALEHYRMGLAFKALRMPEQAAECMRTAAVLDEGAVRALALTILTHESGNACEWSRRAEETAQLREALNRIGLDTPQLLSVFPLLALDCSPQEQLHAARLCSATYARGVAPLPRRRVRTEGRLRVGYLTADICSHATAVLMAEFFERCDRERFEVLVYSHSPDDQSALRARVIAACDRFVDVNSMTDQQIAQRMHADGVDIAVDLKGHTADTRYAVLAHRPAPVQVAFLGYPGTTGADFIDYVIGDPVVTPLEHAPHFSEKIAQLPWSYQPNDRNRVLPPCPSRREEGLPEGATVFCCFNQSYKLNPAMLDLWARILAQVPDSVLWLLEWNGQAPRNLLAELAARGIARERVVFGKRVSIEDHLARLQCADLFLDTWPCNAHTTASEALWAGVPVLTVPGQTFASRVAASLLHACELDELVCGDGDAYVDLAVGLARDRSRLQALQRHLRERRLTLPLFDTARYAADFDALLLRMAERERQGLPPQALPATAPEGRR